MDKNYKNPITVRMDKNNKTIAINNQITVRLDEDCKNQNNYSQNG